jgi:hypothetical protein
MELVEEKYHTLNLDQGLCKRKSFRSEKGGMHPLFLNQPLHEYLI